jgi:hypothetical protein
VGLPQYKDAFLEARIDAREVTQSSQFLKTTKTQEMETARKSETQKGLKTKEKWETYISREI